MVFVNDTNSYLQRNNMNPFMLGKKATKRLSKLIKKQKQKSRSWQKKLGENDAFSQCTVREVEEGR